MTFSRDVFSVCATFWFGSVAAVVSSCVAVKRVVLTGMDDDDDDDKGTKACVVVDGVAARRTTAHANVNGKHNRRLIPSVILLLVDLVVVGYRSVFVVSSGCTGARVVATCNPEMTKERRTTKSILRSVATVVQKEQSRNERWEMRWNDDDNEIYEIGCHPSKKMEGGWRVFNLPEIERIEMCVCVCDASH